MTPPQNLSSVKWQTLSLAEQLGNAGSDFERALRWKEKGQTALFDKAVSRTLEQLDLTLADGRWRSHRRREIARLREETCRTFFTSGHNEPSGLQKYYLSMAALARKNR